MDECGPNLAGSGEGTEVACPEHCDERLGSVKCGPDPE
jgi:hypothetical protein